LGLLNSIQQVLKMSELEKATPLYLHTLETFCEELVSGRTIIIDDDGNEYRLISQEARSIFDWYRNNRGKWAKNVMKQDLETLVEQLEKTPPNLPENVYANKTLRSPRIHLKSVRAHRFAGIHKYGKPERPPEAFYFEFEKPLTLIEGINGAGKTSLLNAITWCLTGHVYRSQRPPELAHEAVELEMLEDLNSGFDNNLKFDMTAITPIPPAEILASLSGVPLLLDTWVELIFVDDEGHEVGSLKRSVKRTSRGKIVIDEPDFSELGLDPIAREIGTKMPGLIPYLQLGVASDLGKAVAGLTGLKPLKDLAKHAVKSQAKLKKDLPNDRIDEIKEIDFNFIKTQVDLAELIKDHSITPPERPLPSPGPEKSIENDLELLKTHFEFLQSQALLEAKAILGDSFDHEDKAARAELMANVGPALGLLDSANLKRLSSARRLSELGCLSLEQLQEAEKIIEVVLGEANQIIKIEDKPVVAARLRLYAKVASWMKDLPDSSHDIKSCSICQRAIDGKLDDITGKLISEHIKEYLEIDSMHLEKTLKAWEEDAKATISKNLPEVLRSEVTRDLPEKPADLISTAICEELFESGLLQGSLMPLKTITEELCKKALGCLKKFEEPDEILLPPGLRRTEGSLVQAIRRIRRAIAFARWRKENDVDCRNAFLKIIGTSIPGVDATKTRDRSVADLALFECLTKLDIMVKGIAPLTEALSKVKTMAKILRERRKKENRIELYRKTAEAIEEFLNLDQIVDRQVAFLINKLLSATLEWREALYVPAFIGAPKVIGTDVGSDGSLTIDAEAQGTKASAQHISNSSDLRATLLSFLFAFWQYLMEVRGGLSLLLVDDLQELFDKDNRRRVANTIPVLIEKGGRLIVTTNDTTFGRRVASSAVRKIGSERIDRRRIHALNAVRQHFELGKFVEAIEAKRTAFERPESQNEAQPARDYIKDLRIYLENRLLDFFDFPDTGLPHNPTLSDLMSGIRSRRKIPIEVFASQSFGKLISDPALANNSPFMNLMNQSHHGNEDEITFNEVWLVKEDCIRVRKNVDAAHEEYERWLRRDNRDPVQCIPACPEAIPHPSFNVPVILDLAAFTADAPATDGYEAEEQFSGSWFENRALYLVNTHNFGFAATPNCRAIVDLSDTPIIDKMIVIAIHGNKVYARRLLRSISNPNLVVLASEAENPSKRPPTLFLPVEEVRLLNVVGILFDNRPHYPKPSQEAELLDHFDFSEDIQLVFRVRGDSAIPLALPGQTILGGNLIMASQLDAFEGTPVAISTSDGSVFKKIGKTVPGKPHVRQFDSIGGLGESILVRTQDIEDSFNTLPLMYSIRRVLGVLYDDN
jgi:hypothetical protein